jgi:hypothetical protein
MRDNPLVKGPAIGCVLRGGSFNNNPNNVRCANRNRNKPDTGTTTTVFGFVLPPHLNSLPEMVHGYWLCSRGFIKMAGRIPG